MLRFVPAIRYHLVTILAAHWAEFVAGYKEWIRPVVFENVRKVLACRTPVLGCHVYQCCGKVKIVPHSCKSRLCPTCGKHATDVWADEVLNGLLDVPYHHLVMSIPWQLRIVVGMNRKEGLNLIVKSATEAIQQWARDVKKMRMGIMLVIHTFGSDMKWHPHVHLIVSAGGLSLDGKEWIATDPRFLMSHKGLKARWKYQVTTRMKEAHKAGCWRFPKSKAFLRQYPCFASMLNKLWSVTWYAWIVASLLDPRFSVGYIGRYTKRAVLAEYRITYYDGKIIRFAYRDYAEGGKTSYMTLKVTTFIGRLVRHIPDKGFPMIRYAGLFANRWRKGYLAKARKALKKWRRQQKVAQPRLNKQETKLTWAERQALYTGTNPLVCPVCGQPMVLVGIVFGSWAEVQEWFQKGGRDPTIPRSLRKAA